MSIQPFHVRFDSDPEHVQAIRLRSEAFAQELGFDERTTGEIGLCVNEAIANVIEHAYQWEKGRPIEFRCEALLGAGGEARGLKFSVRDWGPGIDPSKLPLKTKDPTVPGGLGLYCLREMMDVVEYAPQADGGMLLTITKRLNKQRDNLGSEVNRS